MVRSYYKLLVTASSKTYDTRDDNNWRENAEMECTNLWQETGRTGIIY